MNNDNRYFVYELGFIRRERFQSLEEIKEYYKNKKNIDIDTISYEIYDTKAKGKYQCHWMLQFTDEQFQEFINNL